MFDREVAAERQRHAALQHAVPRIGAAKAIHPEPCFGHEAVARLVRRLHRGDDPGGLQPREVFRVGDLEMLDPVASARAIALGQRFEHADHLVVGGVADRVDRQLPAALGDLVRLGGKVGGRDEAEAARVRLVVIRRLQIGPARSQRAVGVELGAGQPQPVVVHPRRGPSAEDPAPMVDPAGIGKDADLELPLFAEAAEGVPVGLGRAHVGRADQADTKHRLLRRAERLVLHRRVGRRDLGFHQRHRIVHEQAVFNPSARGCDGRGRDPGRAQRRAVADRGMPIDPAQPHRSVLDNGIQIGGGRKALVGP